MAQVQSLEMSRRSLMRTALILVGGSATAGALLSARPAMADATAAPNETSSDAYMSEFASPDPTADWTDITGLREEYREAIRQFPLNLPDGYYFPAESRAVESKEAPGTKYDVGSGGSEAFSFWQSAVATAAYSAHLRKDASTTKRYLDLLETGTRSAVGQMYLDDPEGAYISGVVTPARTGDYSALLATNIDAFTADPVCRAVAANAGDRF